MKKFNPHERERYLVYAGGVHTSTHDTPKAAIANAARHAKKRSGVWVSKQTGSLKHPDGRTLSVHWRP